MLGIFSKKVTNIPNYKRVKNMNPGLPNLEDSGVGK